jgi:hypothetical protein
MFTDAKDPGTLALGSCLEKLGFEKIVAIVDQRYADHRENFKNPISTEIIQGVTGVGSPCKGIGIGS